MWACELDRENDLCRGGLPPWAQALIEDKGVREILEVFGPEPGLDRLSTGQSKEGSQSSLLVSDGLPDAICTAEDDLDEDDLQDFHIFERKKRIFLVRRSKNCPSSSMTVERMIYEYSPEEGQLRGAIASKTRYNHQKLQLFSFDYRVQLYTIDTSDGGSSFSIVDKSEMYPDCDFCKIRHEPCVCPRSLWQRRMKGRHNEVLNSSPLAQIVTYLHLYSGGNNIIDRETWTIGRTHMRSIADYGADNSNPSKSNGSFGFVMGESPAATFQHIITNTYKLFNIGDKDERDLKQDRKQQKDSSHGRRCRFCGTVFRRRYALRRHVNGVHLRERSWKCTLCSATFNQKSHLHVHEKSLHEKSQQFDCQSCHASFSWRANYLRHIRKFHSDAPSA
mmetsp:Transcript_5504/g.16414  ORF Transcript_5504/g.16414 Transcript_5504/m.16414 type:complete len:391 (+) Transcript_5504:55-1227(+)